MNRSMEIEKQGEQDGFERRRKITFSVLPEPQSLELKVAESGDDGDRGKDTNVRLSICDYAPILIPEDDFSFSFFLFCGFKYASHGENIFYITGIWNMPVALYSCIQLLKKKGRICVCVRTEIKLEEYNFYNTNH